MTCYRIKKMHHECDCRLFVGGSGKLCPSCSTLYLCLQKVEEAEKEAYLMCEEWLSVSDAINMEGHLRRIFNDSEETA